MRHGIKLDLEFLAILLGAALVSYFVSGEILSNALFTSLIAVLFFLMGLHLDLDELKKCAHHFREVSLGLAMIYLVVPVLALLVTGLTSGAVSEAFIAIGVSAASIGSPVVLSNLSKGEGDLAMIAGGASLVAGIVAIPALLYLLGDQASILELAARNLAFIGVPLLAGVFAQRFENTLLDDMRHHFSKIGLWLLVVVMGVQFKLVYASQGLSFLSGAWLAVLLMAGFVAASYVLAHLASRMLGFTEPQSRALGFVSSSKSLAVSLFVASQISGAAVAYVSLYYFVRQAVTGGIMELFRHGDLKSLGSPLERIRG